MTFPVLIGLYLRRYRLLFAAVLVLLFLHEIALLYVFQFWKEQGQLSDWLLSIIPGRMREGLGIPLTDLTDPRTYKAIIYMRPDFRALTLLFGIALGTDVIAGEVGRGTSDVLFAHPVRRRDAVLAGAATTAFHVLCVGGMMLLSFRVGTLLFPMGARQPTIAQILPSTVLVVAGAFAISLTAFVFGALCSSRAAAVGWALLFVLLPMVIDFLGVFTDAFTVVARFFPEYYYRPHTILFGLDDPTLGQCLLALAGIGAAALVVSLVIAQRRDLARR